MTVTAYYATSSLYQSHLCRSTQEHQLNDGFILRSQSLREQATREAVRMNQTGTILIIDDEKNIRRALRMVLEGASHQVLDAESAEDGLQVLSQHPEVDAVILDVRLPGMNGIDALKAIRASEAHRNTPVIMISGHAAIHDAVDAVKLGATDFFEKPLDRDRVVVTVRNALDAYRMRQELSQLKGDLEQRYEMIGESDVMRSLYAEIEKLAPTKARVLITGESGTGKELIARAIHRLSTRAKQPFIRLNCAAIAPELIESELFGHERGAFSGALNSHRGVFELADGGTLFLDEIGDMSLSAQAKVLRALQNGEVTRLGSEKTFLVDVRVIAATNKDLEKEVMAGRFRDDLYFRLNVVPIHSPTLRERRSDIALLAQSFAREFCREHGLKYKALSDRTIEDLQTQDWPGNVRELRNVVERMVILGTSKATPSQFPPPPHADNATPVAPISAPHTTPPKGWVTLRAFRDQSEREYILSVLTHCQWNISKAAQLLDTERTNLHKRMRALGISRND